VFALANPLAAQQSPKSTEDERAADAAKVLTEIMNIPENWNFSLIDTTSPIAASHNGGSSFSLTPLSQRPVPSS
jgi:hypothetical protein